MDLINSFYIFHDIIFYIIFVSYDLAIVSSFIIIFTEIKNVYQVKVICIYVLDNLFHFTHVHYLDNVS